MRRAIFVALFLPAVAVIAGCTQDNQNQGAGAPAGKPVADTPRAVRPPPPPPPPETATPPSSPSATAAPSSPATMPSPRLQVELSAGVALPQTGPTGILMSFSVDYRIAAGQPSSSATYVWVVERQQGPPAKEPVRLGDHGTLAVLIPGWRPTDGPFSGHLEDRSGSRLSQSIDLQ